MRSSQPLRTEVPAAARSISSIAAKWERVGFGWPTAWTAPRVPFFHMGNRGASAGCRPNMASPAMA
jgi:hypothetical protein